MLILVNCENKTNDNHVAQILSRMRFGFFNLLLENTPIELCYLSICLLQIRGFLIPYFDQTQQAQISIGDYLKVFLIL